MNKIWRKGTRIEDDDNNGIILPPDEDNYEKHGQDNLVIKYRENKAIFEIDPILHKQCDFYKRKHLDGELERFIADLNSFLEPIRDQMLNLDRFSLNFMLIGFMSTVFIAGLVGWMVSVVFSFGIIVSYLIALGCVLTRNNK
jgi:hypothetical protein